MVRTTFQSRLDCRKDLTAMHKANNERICNANTASTSHAPCITFGCCMSAVGLNLFGSYKSSFVYHVVGVSLELSRPTHAAQHAFIFSGRGPNLFSSADVPSSNFCAPEMNAIHTNQASIRKSSTTGRAPPMNGPSVMAAGSVSTKTLTPPQTAEVEEK